VAVHLLVYPLVNGRSDEKKDSETDLAPETGSGGTQTVTQFVQAALAAGATGLLQFQDGTPALSSEQWSELDAALAAAPTPSS
jgi:hypothetical protein